MWSTITQQSRIESRFSRGSRIECQLTFERYCITKLGLAEGEETSKSFKVLFVSLAKPQLKMTVIQNQGKCSRVWNAEQIWLILARDSKTVQMFLRSLSPFIAIAESCIRWLDYNVTFEFVDEILQCDHSNETSLEELSHDTVCLFVCFCCCCLIFKYFPKWNLEILLNVDCGHFLQRIILLFIIFVPCSVLFLSLYYFSLAFILTVQPNILTYPFCVRLLCTIISS